MIRALALALCASPAAAQDTVLVGKVTPYRQEVSSLTLQPTEAPGAVAEIVFVNRDVNNKDDNGDYALSDAGIEASVTFTWDASGAADGIVVAVPEGFIAHPSSLSVAEGSTGTVLIFSADGVGM